MKRLFNSKLSKSNLANPLWYTMLTFYMCTFECLESKLNNELITEQPFVVVVTFNIGYTENPKQMTFSILISESCDSVIQRWKSLANGLNLDEKRALHTQWSGWPPPIPLLFHILCIPFKQMFTCSYSVFKSPMWKVWSRLSGKMGKYNCNSTSTYWSFYFFTKYTCLHRTVEKEE